jgi:ankyrin repeat protein
MHLGLPHGPVLLENNAKLFQEFLLACRKSKMFAALCNEWRHKFGTQYADLEYVGISNECNYEDNHIVTSIEVDAFDSLFQRGILAAARDDMDPKNQYSKVVSISCGQMIYLLTKHGSNPLERDVRDISLLHWSAGSGRLDALTELIRSLQGGIKEAVKLKADRDGATILHWAAAGANAKNFGCGGHFHVCKYLMENCGSDLEKEIVSSQTKDGNSVLMWAAWSGSFDIVKLMVRHRAAIDVCNRNGCTVAHWAASGGSLQVCRYLHDIGVDFTQPNFAGNTPLSHSVAYGRVDVIHWLKNELKVEDTGSQAMDLALDFFNWDSIDEEDDRKNIIDVLKSSKQIDNL